jgi:ribonuclease BN (tRNA processing enzyme)
MEMTILGAGTAIPMQGRSPASILFKSNKITMMMDIGSGSIHSLVSTGVDPFNLEYIFLSHLHSDHTLDLVTLFQLNDSSPGRIRKKSLHVYGCSGTKLLVEHLFQAYPGISPSTYDLTFRELGEERISLEDLTISSVHSGHTPESLSYRVDSLDCAVVFTADVSPNVDLTGLCQGVDVLISECSFPSGWPVSDHLNADNVGMLAKRAGVKQLIVTHCYPPAIQVDLITQIKQHYSGPVVLAIDGYSFTIPGGYS